MRPAQTPQTSPVQDEQGCPGHDRPCQPQLPGSACQVPPPGWWCLDLPGHEAAVKKGQLQELASMRDIGGAKIGHLPLLEDLAHGPPSRDLQALRLCRVRSHLKCSKLSESPWSARPRARSERRPRPGRSRRSRAAHQAPLPQAPGRLQVSSSLVGVA